MDAMTGREQQEPSVLAQQRITLLPLVKAMA
jgi:hypothetical protein